MINLRRKGFSLIELLIVISIIGVLLTFALFTYRQAQTSGRDGKRRADLAAIASALELYRYECNAYPAAGTGTGSFAFSQPPTIRDLVGTGGGSPTTCDNSNVYMAGIPNDPQYPTRRYYYAPTGASRTGFLLCARLENAPNPAMDVSGCGSNCAGACNYKIVNQ